MAAPVVIAAAPAVATPTVAAAAFASAKAGLAMLPGIAVIVVGVCTIFKAVEIAEEKFDEARIRRAARRLGAEDNQSLAYKRFLERRGVRTYPAEGVRAAVAVPVPQNMPAQPRA